MVRAVEVRATPRYAALAILLVLFATGWAANHFAALLPALADTRGLSRAVLNGAFGIYALGLLPGLIGGGGLSDRLGRRPVVLCGALIAALGNLIMLGQPDQTGIYLGRLILGVGVGLTVSAGTVWTAEVHGEGGAIAAGVALTAGFALGPLFSGLTSQAMSEAVVVPFVVTVALSTVTALAASRLRIAPHDSNVRASIKSTDDGEGRGTAQALKSALPMAVWVFSSASVAMVTMAARIGERYSGPWVPGIAAAVTLGSGAVIQLIARRMNAGPQAGVLGATLAAIGFLLAAAGGPAPSMALFLLTAVLLGFGYGLCLRDGLNDVETMAPAEIRGTLTGLFYIGAYLGFALPVALVVIRPFAGVTAPLLALAGLAATSAVFRVVQITAERRPSEAVAA